MSPLLAAASVSVLAATAFPPPTAAAPARTRFTCLSVRMSVATANLAGQSHTLEMGTVPLGAGLNGELASTFDEQLPTHGTFLRLTNPIFPEPVDGQLVVDVPAGADADRNGFPDFFEVAQAVAPATTQGRYRTAVDSGPITITWSRTAGATAGSYRLTMASDTFGDLPEFSGTFELLEYSGPLTYSTEGGSISGIVRLERAEDPGDVLTGAATFRRSIANRFDTLLLLGNPWTNTARQTLSFPDTVVLRDTQSRSNYFAVVELDDGDLRTSEPDYYDWQLSIDDPNDTDGDGIPDLSDDPPPTPARLRIIEIGDRARIEIVAQAGRRFDVEQAPSLAEPIQWSFVAGVTLNLNVQTLEIPRAAGDTVFWRLRER